MPDLRKIFAGMLAVVLVLVFNADLNAGTVKGKVVTKKDVPRRTARRYPGKHSQKPGKLEPIPAVVMITGPIKGFPPPKPPKNPEIVQKDFAFKPSLLVVPVDTVVSFPNRDMEFHNVFSYSKTKRFDLGRYHQGESKSVRFDKPGIGKIYCEIHEWMRAVIVVVENPFYAVTDAGGHYEIKDIPGGTYELMVWKIDHKRAAKTIIVPPEGTLELDFSLPVDKSKRSKKR